MEEQLLLLLLLLENPLLKVLLLEDERSVWVNPIFDEREKCGKSHTLFPMLLEQAQNFFQYFIMRPDTFWHIPRNIRPYIQKQSNFRKCISNQSFLATSLLWYFLCTSHSGLRSYTKEINFSVSTIFF